MARNYETEEVMKAMNAEMRHLTPHEQIDHDMTNHAPLHPGVVDQFEALRQAAKLFAHTVIDTCPDAVERGYALKAAQEALMWAVASIARHQ